MSLIVLIAIEFVGWVYFNRTIPFSTPRTVIALSTTSGFAASVVIYLSMCDLLAFTPHLDLFYLMIFGLLNALTALVIGFTSFTYQAARG